MLSYALQRWGLNFAPEYNYHQPFPNMEKKPWYQSKIVLLGLAMVTVFGSNLLNGWLTNLGVQPDQMELLQLTYPDMADAFRKASEGGTWLSAIGTIGGGLVVILRKWFTTKLLV